MTSIDPTGRLLAQLQQVAQEMRRHAGGPAKSGPAAKSARRRDAMQLAVEQVTRIDRDDPQARSKAFRAYLAVVLAQEFGAGVVNDPKFAALVDRVGDTMQADPQLQQAIERAGEILLKSAHSR